MFSLLTNISAPYTLLFGSNSIWDRPICSDEIAPLVTPRMNLTQLVSKVEMSVSKLELLVFKLELLVSKVELSVSQVEVSTHYWSEVKYNQCCWAVSQYCETQVRCLRWLNPRLQQGARKLRCVSLVPPVTV